MSTIVVKEKSTGQPVEALPIDEREAVAQAADRARIAQRAWTALSIKERVRFLKLARREFMRDKKKISDALSRETGKVPLDVLGELFSVCQQIGHYSSKAPKWLKPKRVGTFPLIGKKGLICYRPYGLVGVISPWNAPLTLALSDVLPALYAGNAVLVKPSEITPLAVKYTVDAFNRVLPPGVLQCLIGERNTGEALVDEVDMVAVTGSCQTGRHVMERASKRLTPVLLELGGKDPMIVLRDADLERAANAAAWGSCFMTGQVCMSVERIYVEKVVAAEFRRLLKEKIQQLRTGPDKHSDQLDFGPFIGPNQVGIVEAQIADAVSKGARIEFGGSRIQTNGSGIYFEPTLITNVTHDMKIMHEETFGPVACVMEVDNVDEAIFLSNDSAYGLNASVWTRDIKSGIDIASRIEAGNVCVNDAILNAGVQSLPFGGVKQSGVGSRHGGERGLHVFCYTQALMIEGRNKSRESTWFPYIPKTARQMERVMTFLYGRNL
jgi:acyl-CoA reductase-like NAD-dependent aldehyde dehydrogenase